MAEKDAYASWQSSAQEVERIAKDRSLPSWQKAHLVGAAYTTVVLDSLRSKHRHKIFNRIVQVNAILQCYTVNSFDDYQRMDEADLQEIVSLFRAMGPSN
ncbi:hypothetical protein [Kineobactrum salinum]|uniref:Uncharacterized protein n=1 Tax=Kineobactrum salinum TaxID=2708301 RepID=A0A6C0U572_9GAMM|nr:hypothetical protein [Kineobactrum salinum]QIB67310.1 hypothetical protein G3T16_19825 [Kineobactrum salinum]